MAGTTTIRLKAISFAEVTGIYWHSIGILLAFYWHIGIGIRAVRAGYWYLLTRNKDKVIFWLINDKILGKYL
jgi:hypothetical protein